MPNRVMEVNLERGMPTVDIAIRLMKDALTSGRRRGVKAIVLIHGYGSTGTGGAIKAAVKRSLGGADLQGVVREAIGGEQWHYRKKELVTMFRELEGYDRQIANNEGITVVILK